MTITRTIAAATAAVALAIGGQAFASEQAPQLKVDAATYDLSSPRGVHKLDNSLRAAARRVCAVSGQRDSLQVQRLERQCYSQAINGAREQVAALNAKSGTRVAFGPTG